MRLYCAFDIIAQEGGPIFCAKNDNVAKRSFEQITKNVEHPEEYKLMFLGSYNVETCIVNGYSGKEVEINMNTPDDPEEEQK